MTQVSANGHKRAVLYARVSTDEQADKGYSLPSQFDAMRKYAAQQGFEIAGEFSCKGLDTYAIFGKLGGINQGHPDEGDIQNARKFAKGLAKI